MMLNLVKKDFMIVKKYTYTTMGLIVFISLFTRVFNHGIPSGVSLLYMLIIGTLLLLQAISQQESKYPKAAALICAAPYSRKEYVIAKYLVFVAVFAYCYIVDTIIKVIFNRGDVFSVTEALLVLFIGMILFCIYMPIEFKYGVVKARYLLSGTVVIFSMGPALAESLFSNVTLDLSFFNRMPVMMLNTMLAVGCVAVFAVSLGVAMKIFSAKEL